MYNVQCTITTVFHQYTIMYKCSLIVHNIHMLPQYLVLYKCTVPVHNIYIFPQYIVHNNVQTYFYSTQYIYMFPQYLAILPYMIYTTIYEMIWYDMIWYDMIYMIYIYIYVYGIWYIWNAPQLNIIFYRYQIKNFFFYNF